MDNLVSVIVPVYNTASYLDRCIQSVLSQTYQKFELLLVDDGSTDDSGQICDAYAKADLRIRVIHKPNGGVSSARNVGLHSMKGQFFVFLDSDDSLEPDTLRICADIMKADQVDAVVFGRRELQEEKTVCIEKYSNATITDTKQMACDILKDRHIYGGGYPNKMWRRESFASSGEIPLFSEKLFYVEDMEWVIRMLLKAKHVRVIEDVFYRYDLRDDSISRSEKALEKRLIGYHDTMAQMEEDLVEYPDLQNWFAGIRYAELINSIIDARIKKQTAVYKALYGHLKGKAGMLLRGSMLRSKIKLRLIAVQALHIVGLI